ncbi:hypothetical protein CUC04_11205 [Prevotella intermedia]|uniref:Uncharacterized protein n=1 Tax=Prevotella intermedia TaxID=28131 RepID=A0A2G9IDQ6_PREIN|nr:hypothetical protein CUC04_11205 [Prevotella intermedia]
MHGKSGCFASQNSRFRNAKPQLLFFFRTFFTKAKSFSNGLVLKILEILGELESLHTPASLSPPPFIYQQKNAKALRFSIFLVFVLLCQSSVRRHLREWRVGGKRFIASS